MQNIVVLGVLPRGSKYPAVDAFAAKQHTLNRFWKQKPQILGILTICGVVFYLHHPRELPALLWIDSKAIIGMDIEFYVGLYSGPY